MLITKLDLSSAYQQLSLDAQSRKLTVINTLRGACSVTRAQDCLMAFHQLLRSSSQRVMDNLLKGIPGVCAYLDDILITGSSEE